MDPQTDFASTYSSEYPTNLDKKKMLIRLEPNYQKKSITDILGPNFNN